MRSLIFLGLLAASMGGLPEVPEPPRRDPDPPRPPRPEPDQPPSLTPVATKETDQRWTDVEGSVASRLESRALVFDSISESPPPPIVEAPPSRAERRRWDRARQKVEKKQRKKLEKHGR